MSEAFVGEIRLFAGNFAPRGWALCQGQLLSIAAYSALYSLLSTTYGGDGRTTFALPDMRGRAPVHVGQGNGLRKWELGKQEGVETIQLSINEMPNHNHSVCASSKVGTLPASDEAVWGATGGRTAKKIYGSAINPNIKMSPNVLSPAGGTQPHNNRQPYLCMNYIICLAGIFPPRD